MRSLDLAWARRFHLASTMATRWHLRGADADSWALHVDRPDAPPRIAVGLSTNSLAARMAGRASRNATASSNTYRLVPWPGYDAIAAKQIDVMDIYTTDAKIAHLGLAVLKDDQEYFPRYDALVLYRLDVPQRFPQAWAALTRLAGSIDEKAMIAMNARAELDGVPFDAIARDHLAQGSAVTERPARLRPTAETRPGPLDAASFALWRLGGIVPAAFHWRCGPSNLGAASSLGATGLLQTVPSLALLAILIWLVGAIGVVPAVIALTLYALLPIMRNTVTGLAEVPQGLRDAGLALGMTPGQRLVLVELPLAWPTIWPASALPPRCDREATMRSPRSSGPRLRRAHRRPAWLPSTLGDSACWPARCPLRMALVRRGLVRRHARVREPALRGQARCATQGASVGASHRQESEVPDSKAGL